MIVEIDAKVQVSITIRITPELLRHTFFQKASHLENFRKICVHSGHPQSCREQLLMNRRNKFCRELALNRQFERDDWLVGVFVCLLGEITCLIAIPHRHTFYSKMYKPKRRTSINSSSGFVNFTVLTLYSSSTASCTSPKGSLEVVVGLSSFLVEALMESPGIHRWTSTRCWMYLQCSCQFQDHFVMLHHIWKLFNLLFDHIPVIPHQNPLLPPG